MNIENFEYYKLEPIHDDKVLVITFSRPPINAFIKECYEELSKIINIVNNSKKITTVVLKSDQKHFSAGADIKQLEKDKKDSPDKAVSRRASLRKSLHNIYKCKVPVVVAVNGGAVGIGAMIAACGDIIVAEDNAFFSIPEINIGIVGGATLLSRLLPPQKIRTLAFTGGRISAKEIYQYGGIEAIVSKEKLSEKALEYAISIADKGTEITRKWKEAFLLTEKTGILEGELIEYSLNQEIV